MLIYIIVSVVCLIFRGASLGTIQAQNIMQQMYLSLEWTNLYIIILILLVLGHSLNQKKG